MEGNATSKVKNGFLQLVNPDGTHATIINVRDALYIAALPDTETSIQIEWPTKSMTLLMNSRASRDNMLKSLGCAALGEEDT